MKLSDLVGRSLDGFTVQKCTEVFAVNGAGARARSLGFFKNPTIAQGFAKNRIWDDYRTRPVLVLASGARGFPLNDSESIDGIFDGEETFRKIRDQALAKLTPEERIVLNL